MTIIRPAVVLLAILGNGAFIAAASSCRQSCPIPNSQHWPSSSGPQALPLGLVNQAVCPGQRLGGYSTFARCLLAKSARATELTKMLINAADGEDLDRVLESLAGGIAAGSDELAEGLAAFRAKRKPDFKG